MESGDCPHSLRRESLDSATVFHPLIRPRSLSLMTAVRRMQLARLGVWIGLATVAVLTAVLTARTESGIRRIATLLSPAQVEPVRSAKGPAPQIANRQFDQEAEQRRLSEAVRTLAADRDRLARPPQYARTQYRGRHRLDRPGRKGAATAQHPGDPCAQRDGACATCRSARFRCTANRCAGRAEPESRCGRPSRDQQPDRRRIGRHQDRVRRRSRRQRHDRRTAHHVVEPEGDASPRCWKGCAP